MIQFLFQSSGFNPSGIRKSFFILAGVLLFFNSALISQQPADQKPVPVIFDTDIGPDYDDVGAMAVLHALADSGECTILATMASNRSKYAAATLDVLNTYFKRPKIPIGVVGGQAVDMVAPQKWDSLLVANYPHTIKSNADVSEATELYRKILADQPDKSVTIVTVGFFTNMANLLASGPDKYSGLNGKALVEKKCAQLVSMAGRFDEEMSSFKEFNVVKDAKSSKYCFDNWPTPILFSGFEIGVKIHTGLPITNSNIKNSPVKEVFSTSIPLDPNDSKGRMSWDETAVLVAIRSQRNYFGLEKGAIIGKDDGTVGWDKKGNRDAFLVHKMPVAEIEKILNSLIEHQPSR